MLVMNRCKHMPSHLAGYLVTAIMLLYNVLNSHGQFKINSY